MLLPTLHAGNTLMHLCKFTLYNSHKSEIAIHSDSKKRIEFIQWRSRPTWRRRYCRHSPPDSRLPGHVPL